MILARILAALRSLTGTGRPDDLTALAAAAGVLREPTPIHDEAAAWAARIDAAVECWAAEVEALADAELRDLIEGDR